MAILSKIRDWFRRDRAARRQAEYDAPADPGTARSRATGGEPDPDAPDRHSTTGTTPSGTFVGRASGDDPGNLDDPTEHRRLSEDDTDENAGT